MSIVDDMKRLSAAEEFFVLLGVPFDPAVMNRARLHILKRIGLAIAKGELDGLDDTLARSKAKALLVAAYGEFAAAPAIDKRLFKVLADRDPARPKRKGAFVPLADLAPVSSLARQ
jgi:nitrogenase-stabilizing/protective protein